MPARLVAVVTLAVAALVAAPAYGKGDVTATIVTPIPADAEPGTQVRVVWSLRIEEGSHPVNADGVYLRRRRRRRLTAGRLRPSGSARGRVYAATVRVPVGGVERAVVGIRGTASYAGGRTVRRDAFFALANEPVAAASSGRSWGMPLTGIALAAFAAVALGLAWSRRAAGRSRGDGGVDSRRARRGPDRDRHALRGRRRGRPRPLPRARPPPRRQRLRRARRHRVDRRVADAHRRREGAPLAHGRGGGRRPGDRRRRRGHLRHAPLGRAREARRRRGRRRLARRHALLQQAAAARDRGALPGRRRRDRAAGRSPTTSRAASSSTSSPRRSPSSPRSRPSAR